MKTEAIILRVVGSSGNGDQEQNRVDPGNVARFTADGHEMETEVVVYTRRWYLLLLFSVFSMLSCAIWNTWGPIASSASLVYKWEASTLTLFTMWGCMAFPPLFLPSAWLLGVSLRASVVVAAFCTFIGSGIRCIPLLLHLDQDVFTILCHIGAFINASGGPIFMSAPIGISASWFPAKERTTATSIAQLANVLGVGLSFVLGTYLVRETADTADSDTCSPGENLTRPKAKTTQATTTLEESDVLRQDIERLLYIQTGASALLLLLVLIYYPSKPPSPPSPSASAPRTNFLAGFKQILQSRPAWLTMLTYSLSQGLIQMWQSVMVINLVSLCLPDITEKWSSTLGIVISFVSVAASIAFALLMDCFKRKMKLVIALLLLSSGVIFLICALIFQRVISFSDSTGFQISVYVLLLAGMSLATATAPILFEFSVETCYPIAEGSIGTWLTLWFNTFSVIFFLVFQIPNIGTEWLNYVLPASVLVPLPAFLLIQENYNRLQVDETRNKEQEPKHSQPNEPVLD